MSGEIEKIFFVVMVILSAGLIVEHSRLAIIPLFIAAGLAWRELFKGEINETK